MDQAPQAVRTKGRKAVMPAAKLASGNGISHRGPIAPLQTLPADHAEMRSRQVLAAMIAFSNGDFGSRLPSDWSGTDGRIAEAFNQTIRNAERITDEAARLSTTVGK